MEGPGLMTTPLTVLGLETSCDETAAAVVRLDRDGRAEILAEALYSQLDEHRAFGGVVPEIAARAHVERLDRLVLEAVERAGCGFAGLDGVAATAGPGLIGGVIVGLVTGKALASALQKPFLAINHLEGHALTARLTDGIGFPYLLFLASGGHTQLLIVEDVGRYRRIGTTLDDALGEAFDKTAKLLGLGFPGGPAVEAAARAGRAEAFDLPRPLVGRPGCDFSLAGLKTAVRLAGEAKAPLGEQDVADLCAAFQEAVGAIVADRVGRALDQFQAAFPGQEERLVIAGGVAANAVLRARLEALCAERGARLVAPPARLCTDNAAMIAHAGALRLARGERHGLDAEARPRWPLDEESATILGSGRKGAKA